MTDHSAGISVAAERCLLAAARDGCSISFTQLVSRYHARLDGSVKLLVGCHATAEDVVQDVWIVAWVHLGSFRGESAFYTWLYRIARNRAYDLSNHPRRVSETVSCDDPSVAAIEDSAADPLHRLLSVEQMRLIKAAIRSLPEKHRTILEQLAHEESDYKGLSHRLSIKLGTVRSRLAQARQYLHSRLRTRGYHFT